MDKASIIEQLKTVIHRLTNFTITNDDQNLFDNECHISPVNMVYLLLELEQVFPVSINDSFMDTLPEITVNHLANAIYVNSKEPIVTIQ